MKKVAVIWSSPNKDGLTASAKDRFIMGLASAGADVMPQRIISLLKRDAFWLHVPAGPAGGHWSV